MSFNKRVWFITGCSTGLGRAMAEAVIEHGDKLVATARNVESLAELEAMAPDRFAAMPLDVVDDVSIMRAVKHGVEKFGTIDILVNNAATGIVGAVEESSLAEMRSIYEINVMGPIGVTKAILPIMRGQRSGHVIFVTSAGGINGYPGTGVYCSSKAAIDALADVMAMEVAPLGIRVSTFVPGLFRTEFRTRTMVRTGERIEDYGPMIDPIRVSACAPYPDNAGDPRLVGKAMIALVCRQEPMRRCALGAGAAEAMQSKIDALQRDLEGSGKLAAALS